MVLIFLDYDGVLHPDGVTLRAGEPAAVDDTPLFAWAPLLEQVLAEFDRSRVRIVLSTSWVFEFGLDKAASWLSPSLRELVCGATWERGSYLSTGVTQAHFKRMRRHEAIAHYVRRNRVAHWIAVDNDPHFPASMQANLVKTKDTEGLSDPAAVDRLRQLLVRELEAESARSATEGCP